jgi:ABC-type multidrug transport system permease subunit
MERLKTLTTLVYLLAGLLVLELAFLIHLLRPQRMVLWMTLGAIAVVGIYLVRMSLGLLRELKEREEEK